MAKAKEKKHPGPRSASVSRRMDGDKPKPRTQWMDFQKRKLKITKVVNGRVHGKITYNPSPNQDKNKERTDDYSCDLKIFEHIWMKQAAPADPIAMQMNSKEAIG